MLAYLRNELTWHTATARHIARHAAPWVLLVPLVGAVVIAALGSAPALAPYLAKDSAELVSPLILAAALLLAAAVYLTRPSHPYFAWQSLFALALFLRELHFTGTNTGFYVALVVLLVWASHARERLEPFFSDRRIVSLLVALIWTYAVSKTFDRRYWDTLLEAHGFTRDLFEENLEVIGHLTFLALVVLSLFVDAAPASPARTDE